MNSFKPRRWWGVLVAGAALVFPGIPAWASTPLCTSGAFLVKEPPLVDSAPAPANDRILIRDSRVSFASCPDVPAKVFRIGNGTRVRAKWASCNGLGGRVRLRMTIDSSCQTLHGKLVVKDAGYRKLFTAESAVPAPMVALDEAIEPSTATLPSLDGGADRPVAAVADGAGTRAELVENELIVQTDDMNALDALVARYAGTVVSSFSPAELGIAGEGVYLVRIDPALADSAALVANLKALNPESTGSLRVSSRAALGLISAGAEEAAKGLKVGLNFAPRGETYQDRSINDGNLFGNAFIRNYLRGNCTAQWGPCADAGVPLPNIGVTEAWRAMDRVGRFRNRVTIAVLDGGFSSQASSDFPAGNWVHANFASTSDLNTPNPLSCTGGAACPWHGTNVMQAAMAQPDNRTATAGPAGRIADLITITTVDMFTQMRALGVASGRGARIANISSSLSVPATLSFSLLPYDAVTAAVRRAGVLIFAAAGNSNIDVDAEDCAWPFDWPCWERAWHAPCENAGVICVGGIDGLGDKAANSNFGAEEVDIYAPYTVTVGPDPGAGVRSSSGTSFSSPFTAGVAALIWASNPAFSADDVERALLETAWPGRDGRVNRYVNAYAAVIRALDRNVPPEIRITAPMPGTYPRSFSGWEVGFTADVYDREDGTPSIVWASDRDGELSREVNFVHNNLSIGRHVIRATVTDSAGVSVSDEVVIDMALRPPTADIRQPADGAHVFAGQQVSFQAFVFDPDTPDGSPQGLVAWSSDRDGFLGFGASMTSAACGGTGWSCLQTVGAHRITLRVLGVKGGEASDTITLYVDPPVANNPPTVRIDQPSSDTRIFTTGVDANAGYLPYVDIWVQAYASDPEDGVIDESKQGQYFVWWTNQTDLPVWNCDELAGCLGFGPGTRVRLYNRYPRCGAQMEHVITVQVSDSAGNIATASRKMIIANGPC